MSETEKPTLALGTKDPRACRARVVLIGDASTGKSSLLMRYVRDRFSESNSSTIGIDFAAREVKPAAAAKRCVQLQIWDVAGQERFRAVARSYYRNSAGAILVFDANCARSFESLAFWLKEFQEHNGHPEPINSQWGPPVVLLCNKVDRPDAERQVTHEQIKALAEEYGIPAWFEVSAKSGFQVHAAFSELAKLLSSQLDALDANASLDAQALLPGVERPMQQTVSLDQTAVKRMCC
jgi:small GTP-binding protein